MRVCSAFSLEVVARKEDIYSDTIVPINPGISETGFI